MGSRLSAADRQIKADRAVELSARGWYATEISEEIGVSANTVRKLIKDELAARAEHREGEKEKAIAEYEAIIRAAWARYEKVADQSLNASGLLNTIKAAQDSINKVTGAEAPRRSEISHRDATATEKEARELADEIRALEAEIASEEAALAGAEEGEG